MGLKAVAAKAAAVAFKAGGDALELITYSSVAGTPVYDPTAGTLTGAATSVNIRALMESTTENEMEEVSLIRDSGATGVLKFTVKAADLSFVPKGGDKITRPNGKVLFVVAVLPGDPTTAIYQVFAGERG